MESNPIDDTSTSKVVADDTKIDDTKIDDTKIAETKIDDTKIEDTKIDDTKIEKSCQNDVSEPDCDKTVDTPLTKDETIDTKEEENTTSSDEPEHKNTPETEEEAEQKEILEKLIKETKKEDGGTEKPKPKLKKKFSRQVTEELKPNKNLLPLKVLIFFVYGGLYCVTPYFTLHMQQLGISVEEIAVITSILPIPAIIGPIISGMVADWSSNFKAVLAGNILMTVVLGVMTTYTPTSYTPLQVTPLHLPVLPPSLHLCAANASQLKLFDCNADCMGMEADDSANRTSVVCVTGAEEEDTKCYLEEDSISTCGEVLPNADAATLKKKRSVEEMEDLANQSSTDVGLDHEETVVMTTIAQLSVMESPVIASDEGEMAAEKVSSESSVSTAPVPGVGDSTVAAVIPDVRSSHPEKLTSKTPESPENSVGVVSEEKDHTVPPEIVDACSAKCTESPRNHPKPSGFSGSETFWYYFLLRVLHMLFMNSSFTLMDASVMAVIGRHGGEYGKHRLVAMMALALMPFTASLIIQGMIPVFGFPNYAIAYYVMSGMLLSGVLLLFRGNMKIQVDKSEHSAAQFMGEVKSLLQRSRIRIFLTVLLLLGMMWGFLESYLFVFLTELNAPTYMLGLTMTFACVTGIPILIVADKIVNFCGRDRIFFMGFLAYTVRMFGYSYLTNPWYCFMFESLEVFTYQLMWVAAVTSFPLLAPKSLLATLTGLAGAVHYNIGRGAGTFLGGFGFSMIGMIWTFRAFGIAAFLFAILYFFLQRKIRLDGQQEPDVTAEEEKEEEVGKESAEVV